MKYLYIEESIDQQSDVCERVYFYKDAVLFVLMSGEEPVTSYMSSFEEVMKRDWRVMSFASLEDLIDNGQLSDRFRSLVAKTLI